MTALTFDLPAAAAGQPSSDFGGELLRIVRRRRWIILATVVLVTSAATLFALLWPPTYMATAKLLVQTQSADPRSGLDAVPTAAQDEALVAYQVQFLESRGLAQQVASRLGLDDDPEYVPNLRPRRLQTAAERRSNLEAATDNLVRSTLIRRVGRTAVILVAVKSSSAKQTARIADRFVSEDIRLLKGELSKSNAATIALLGPRVAAMREQVIAADRAVDDYRRRHNIVGTPGDADLSRLGQLAGALTEARSSRSEAAVRSSVAANGASPATAASSPLLNDLRRQAAETGKHVAELSAFYGPGYPEVARSEAQLADINRRIVDETSRVASQLRSEVAVVQARERQISADLSKLGASTLTQRSASVKLMDLQRSADASRAQYILQLTRLEQLNGAAGLTQVPVRLLTPAVVPDAPYFPRRNQIIGVALAGGFFMGLILAYALELLSESRIRTGQQVQRLIGAVPLAMIPEFSAAEGVPLQQLLAEQPRSVLAEAMRGAYLDLRQRLPAARSHIVLVTSPLPGEGKTTTAIGIAAAAALLGRRAVVVDLDLRRPDVLVAARAEVREVDLVSWLKSGGAVDDVVIADSRVTGLAFVGVRKPPEDPAAAIASPRLEVLLDRLREKFDLIVINAPPVLAVRDAKTISNRVHGSVLVVRWGESRTEAVRTAAVTFGKPFSGVIINRVNLKQHGAAAYGDALQHLEDCVGYFGAGPSPTRQAA